MHFIVTSLEKPSTKPKGASQARETGESEEGRSDPKPRVTDALNGQMEENDALPSGHNHRGAI